MTKPLEGADDQGLMALVKRRWRTMGATMALVMLAGTVSMATAPRIYQSTAKLLIMRSDQRLGGLKVVNDDLPELTLENSPLFTQVELLRVAPVFQDVIDRLGLKDTHGKPLTPDALAAQVKVAPIEKTDLIQISYQARRAQQAQAVVAAVIRAYVETAEHQRVDGVRDGLHYVDDQLEHAHRRLLHAEDALLAYKRQVGSVEMGAEIQNSVSQIGALDAEVREHQIALASAEARAASLRGQIGMSAASGIAAANAAQDPTLAALRTQLLAAESSPVLSQGLGAHNAELMALKDHIALLKRAIAQAEQRLNTRAPAPMSELKLSLLRDLAQAETEVKADQASVAAAEARRHQLSAATSRLPDEQLELARLQREVDVATQLYQGLLQKREEANLDLAIAPTSSRVVQPATLPVLPNSPLRGPAAPIWIVAAIAAAFAAGAIHDLLAPRLHPDDLPSNLPELGLYAGIPLLSWSERRQGELVSAGHLHAAYQEAMRTLGMAIEDAFNGQTGRVLALTSPQPREGKSVTIANLALALAESGHRVLLVDGDFRRPRQHELFGLVPEAPGLTDVLNRVATPEQVIQRVQGIGLVTAGASPITASLAKLRIGLGPALEAWRGSFDYILLDLPPLVLLSEVVQASREADGLLLLANLQNNQPQALAKAVTQLQSLRAPLMGVAAITEMLGKPKRNGYYLIAGEGLVS